MDAGRILLGARGGKVKKVNHCREPLPQEVRCHFLGAGIRLSVLGPLIPRFGNHDSWMEHAMRTMPPGTGEKLSFTNPSRIIHTSAFDRRRNGKVSMN